MAAAAGNGRAMSTAPKQAQYVLPEVPYDRAALQPIISARTMELHHGTHHATYVKTANELLEKLSELPPDGDSAALERALNFNISGHLLHSLFWTCMSPNGGGRPTGSLAGALTNTFGSVDRVVDRLTAAVTTLSGSGWGALVWEPRADRLMVTQIHDHQNDHVAGAVPLLVIDGWEHAYYLQYEAARAKWAKAFWDIVDWRTVADRPATWAAAR